MMARRTHRGKAAQRRITDTKHKEGHKGDGEKTSTAVGDSEFPCERELPPKKKEEKEGRSEERDGHQTWMEERKTEERKQTVVSRK